MALARREYAEIEVRKPTNMRNLVVLVIDRFNSAFLGCLGNAWLPTPEFDRLAVEGWVLDQALAVGPELTDFYEAVWEGRHPGYRRAGAAPPARLAIVSAAPGLTPWSSGPTPT